MPASVINIGGPTSQNTWAAVRSPMWNGTGYLDETLPANKNWSRAWQFYAPSATPFSSGYPEAVSPMLRAFPFLKYGGTGILWSSTSMNIGCDYKFIDSNPTKVEWFLNVGEGEARTNSESPYQTYQEVHNGYGIYMAFTPGKVGYDINSTRATFLGTTVSVTLTPGPGMSAVTLSKTFTNSDVEALFRDDPQWNYDDRGVSLGQYTWPGDPDDAWPYPHWTINSVTLA